MATGNPIDDKLEQAVLKIGIPPCPVILLDIAEEARKDEPDFQKIEKLISADVGLSAALIKTINSPFYGLRTKVHSIMQAIRMLGLKHLSLMIMGMVLRNVLKGQSQIEMGRFWDASTKVAIISSYIASRLPYITYEKRPRKIDKDEAYTYGLFQDCGIPILLNHHPGYKDVLKAANGLADAKFTDFEDDEYGNNHAQVGYFLAKSWGLPEQMYNAIRMHHEHVALESDANFLSAESKDYIALALLAERAIQIITWQSQTCEWQKGRSWVMQHLGLSEEDFNSIINGIKILHDEGNLNN